MGECVWVGGRGVATVRESFSVSVRASVHDLGGGLTRCDAPPALLAAPAAAAAAAPSKGEGE